MILRDFFSKHKCSQFKIIHQGGKENSKYAIGNLVMRKRNFSDHFPAEIGGYKTYLFSN